jgi:AcrR family transcriptional regulator
MVRRVSTPEPARTPPPARSGRTPLPAQSGRPPLPAQSGPPPASARGARTRELLVEAARRVFERDGFIDARITDIAAEAGVATGSFYTYFRRKEDAFAVVIEQLGQEMLHPRLREIADREDPIAVIEAANRAYLTAYRKNARLMGLMEQVALLDADFHEVRLRRARRFTERNARAIARLQERGLADRTLNPRLAAQAVSVMVSRTAYLRYVEGIGKDSLETVVQTLTRLWAGALGIGPTHPRNRPTSDRVGDASANP